MLYLGAFYRIVSLKKSRARFGARADLETSDTHPLGSMTSSLAIRVMAGVEHIISCHGPGGNVRPRVVAEASPAGFLSLRSL